MRMKQITAPSMQEALALARKELGEGAVLLDSKTDKGKGIIVTFAIEAEMEAEQAIARAIAEVEAAETLPYISAPEIPKPATRGAELAHPALGIIREVLSYHHVPQPLFDHLIAKAAQAKLAIDTEMRVAEDALAQALQAMLKFKPIRMAGKPAEKAIMLVGPHGAGKSSAIAKLATELTLHKRRVSLISTDMEKLGATENLARIAKLLKCPFAIAESRNQVKGLLNDPAMQGQILIDSAGVNIYEFKELKAMGEIAGLNGVEPILTCPAGIDADEAAEMASVFSFLPIERMLITRTDAVRRFSSIFSALAASNYALCNVSGSSLPADACAALSATGLAQLMMRQARERTHT